MAKEVKVHVTHFENPSKFYFWFEDSEQQKNKNKLLRKQIETEVARVAKSALPKGCAKVRGSVSWQIFTSFPLRGMQ